MVLHCGCSTIHFGIFKPGVYFPVILAPEGLMLRTIWDINPVLSETLQPQFTKRLQCYPYPYPVIHRSSHSACIATYCIVSVGQLYLTTLFVRYRRPVAARYWRSPCVRDDALDTMEHCVTNSTSLLWDQQGCAGDVLSSS